MYTEYFGFREKPFNATPNSRFFYTNPAYQEAYATLVYGIRDRKGFVLLTGEVGTGKTTLLRRLMVNLEASVRFVFVYNTTLTFEELLSLICGGFNLPVEGKGRLEKIQALNIFLTTQMENGGTAALLVDEAQNLTDDVLENLRLLSNLEASGEKLLQIVLVGQPELERKLAQPELRQLKQRIALRCRLDRLKDREVASFIHYRLSAVGYERQDLFTPEAIQHIALYARGIPRLINIICDNALLIAYGVSQKIVSAKIVDVVAQDLRLPGEEQASQEASLPAKAPFSNANWESIGLPYYGHAHSRRKNLAFVGALALLVLGGSAATLYPWSGRDRLADFSSTVKDLIHYTGQRLGLLSSDQNGRSTLLESSADDIEAKPDQAPANSLPNTRRGSQEALRHSPSSGALSFTSSQFKTEHEDQRQERPLDLYGSIELKKKDLAIGEDSNQLLGLSSASLPTSASIWKERPIVIRSGSTIFGIAADVYGTNLFLAIDLLKEFNPHIENLNWVLAGQKLWLPPLNQETLLRKQQDGSYCLILSSSRSLSGAERFARTVRRRGYSILTTPRRVSNDVVLYRVEISNLKNLDSANKAWEVARTNRWLATEEKATAH